MKTTLHPVSLSAPISGLHALATKGSWAWGLRTLADLRTRWVLCVFLVTLVASILVAFYNVVNQAVYLGQLHRQALAAQSRAIWRCKLLPSISERQECLLVAPALLACGDRSAAQMPRCP